MAMETDVARSDTQTVLNKIQEIIKNLFKLLLLKVILPTTKKATSYIYRHNVAGIRRVLKDGPTKETDRIKGLSYEESLSVLIDYQEKDIETYIVVENGEDNVIDKKKTKAAIENFTKTARQLRKAKNDLADNPKSKRLQNKIEKLQLKYNQKVQQFEEGFDETKYNELLQEAVTRKFPNDPRKSGLDLSQSERDEIYKKSCSGKPIKFTVVTNARWKDQNEKTRDRIFEVRTAKKQEKVDDILSITEQEEYEKMPYDEVEFNKIVSEQKERLGRELNDSEINDIKDMCKYAQITVEQFKSDAQKNNMGYCIYQYDKDKADTICKELNSNDDIEKFTCEFSKNSEGKEIVNIYIYDKDNIIYEHKEGVPFQHYSYSKKALENKEEVKDASGLKSQVAFEGTKVTVDYEQINMAQRVFKDMDYNFSVISNSDGKKQAQFVLENITEDDARKMLIEEKKSNAVQESLFKHKENDKQRTKAEAKLSNNNSVVSIISGLRKKVNENETTKEFVEKYDEFKQMNNNNDLSSEKYNELFNAFFNDKDNLKEIAKTLPEKDTKTNINNDNTKETNEVNEELADNELEIDNFDGFADLDLDGKE